MFRTSFFLTAAFLLLFFIAAHADGGIDSVSGSDLPIGAGGVQAMNIQAGTGRVAVGGNYAPSGTLDVENGKNTATFCLNGNCVAHFPVPPTCTGANVLQFNGSSYVCTSIAQALPGMICGFATQDHVYGHINVMGCAGYDPQYGCPAGYTQRAMFASDSNTLFTCAPN